MRMPHREFMANLARYARVWLPHQTYFMAACKPSSTNQASLSTEGWLFVLRKLDTLPHTSAKRDIWLARLGGDITVACVSCVGGAKSTQARYGLASEQSAHDGPQTCVAVSLSTPVCRKTRTVTRYELAVIILATAYMDCRMKLLRSLIH